jgi:dipeptidyl aminopeptidase/acylaminoacyl peptidase
MAILVGAQPRGVLLPSIPVFLTQGTTDSPVRPQVTKDYMQRLCRAGRRVRMLFLPNVSHGSPAATAPTRL